MVHIPDVLADSEYRQPEAQKLGRWRTMLGVPLLREGIPIGALTLTRSDVRPFTDKQIELLTTFADQAVIAIENVRLFDEVQARTRELAHSVEELRALGQVSQAVNSTLDVQNVLATIVAKAAQLSGTEAGAIYVFDEQQREFQLSATYGMSEELIAAVRDMHAGISEAVGLATETHEPTQVADLRELPSTPVNDAILRTGYRARLIVPMMRSGVVVGALVVRRKAPGEFSSNTIDLLKTFAAQSVIAIQNARLFSEIGEKSHQLEIASQHKSQFLANMSHELRTPLNAVLGYTELILDSVYGEMPERARSVLDRVQRNGRHLLGLINDVLDLSKIEAGQLTLSLSDYSLKSVIQTVFSAVEPLASEKQIALKVDVAPELPPGRGDERRLTQVLLNLVGNAIKFTDSGEVSIKGFSANGSFTVAVHDTGPGISEADITDLLAGQVQMYFDTVALFLPYIKVGKLKALAVADDVRSAELAAVPTTIESGFPTLQATFWASIVAPIGTPEYIIDKLNASINQFLRSPEVEATLAKFNAKPKIGSPEEFARFWRSETEKWTNIIRSADIKAD
jgi:signal transduction histidine kinase